MRPAPVLPLLLLALVFAGLGVFACRATEPTPKQVPANFRIDGERFLLDGRDFRIRSVVLEPFMPGEAPGSEAPTKLDYAATLARVKALHANTVYLLTGEPENIQPAFFERAKAEGLHVILGLWFSGEANDYAGHSHDFQNPFFKEHVKDLIHRFVDKVHNSGGASYSDQILYYTLGNELLEPDVRNTFFKARKVDSFHGSFVSIDKADPTECFLAEMMDTCKAYEAQRYGEVHYVSHHTWSVVSPKPLKNAFLDVISYNLYSYWPDFVTKHSPGSATKTAYQGALEEIASNYPGKPFVVSEVGIAVTPNSSTASTNEVGQAEEIAARWKDITTSKRRIAGVSVHQLYDQWWKTGGGAASPANDKNEHDPSDYEEWFGLVEVGGTVEKPEFRERPAFKRLQELWAAEADSPASASK